jgi:hypothetical protein
MNYLEAVEKEQDKCRTLHALLEAGGVSIMPWVKTVSRLPVADMEQDLLIQRTLDPTDDSGGRFAIARYDGIWWVQEGVWQTGRGWIELTTTPDYWCDLSGVQ